MRCWSCLQVTACATSLCPPWPLEIRSCQRFWLLGHTLGYTDARHKKLSMIQEKQSNACRLRCQRGDENHSWKGNKKIDAFQSELAGNLPDSAVFFLWEGQRCFLLKTGSRRTLACRNFVSGGIPDQQKQKRKQPWNKWTLVPKSSSKRPNPDLSFFRWQQSLVPDSQTYSHLWPFYTFGSRGKGWMS